MLIKPLYQILIDEGLVPKESFDGVDEKSKHSIDHILSGDYLPFDKMARVLKAHYNIPYCNLTEVEIDDSAAALLDYKTAMKHLAFPVRINGDVLVTAMANPFNPTGLEDIFILTGYRAEPVFCRERDVKYFIFKYYAPDQINTISSQFISDEGLKKSSSEPDPRHLADIQNAPAVKLLDSLLESAVLHHASDIHIEPFEDTARTRYRIDGRLIAFQDINISMLPYIISRIKIKGKMNISEKRLPQDGHFKMEPFGQIDFRVSTIPTIYGEKAVIRLIYNQGGNVDIHSLGFFPNDVTSILELLNTPHGAVLVTGPTGSGKTTSLAGFINQLNKDDVNIVTIEDPVENIIPGVNQINVNPGAGLTFDNVLRSILRQDPDVIMVGEIRDSQTAALTIRAAITGHLVLSTVHTNDAVSAVIRLIDMGVEHYLVAAAVTCIISQRLVRTICPNCKIMSAPTKQERLLSRLDSGTAVYRGEGCAQCGYTGYRGRKAVYEYIVVNDAFRTLIDRKASYDEMKSYMRENGIKTIRENALASVLSGDTTIEEMIRAVYSV